MSYATIVVGTDGSDSAMESVRQAAPPARVSDLSRKAHGGRSHVLVGAALALALALSIGTAGTADAATNAQCMLGAHISFSDGISMQHSVGDISADSGSWACTGELGGRRVGGVQRLAVSGSYGEVSDAVVGEFGPDTCMAGTEVLNASDVAFSSKVWQLTGLPAPVTLRLLLSRTLATLQVDGVGVVDGHGLSITGSGLLAPDAPLACLTTGWSSGYVSLMLHVVDGAIPSDMAQSAPAPQHRQRARHRRHRHRTRH